MLGLQGATRRMQLQIELRGLRLIEVQAAMRTKVEAKQVRFQQQWMCLRSLNLAWILTCSFCHVCQEGWCMLSCHRVAFKLPVPARLQDEILRMNDRTYRKFLRFNLRQRGDMLKVLFVTGGCC